MSILRATLSVLLPMAFLGGCSIPDLPDDPEPPTPPGTSGLPLELLFLYRQELHDGAGFRVFVSRLHEITAGDVCLYTGVGAAGSRAWLRPIGSDWLAVRLDIAGRDTALVTSDGKAATALTDLVWAGDTTLVAYETELHVYSKSSK